MVLLGNLNPVTVLRNGDPAGVTAAIAQCHREAGARFIWRETVTGTPNPSFRKIDIAVMEPDRPDYTVAHLVGYLGATRSP